MEETNKLNLSKNPLTEIKDVILENPSIFQKVSIMRIVQNWYTIKKLSFIFKIWRVASVLEIDLSFIEATVEPLYSRHAL